MEKPFIELLQVNDGFYFYDVNTGNIGQIAKEAYDYLNGLIHDENPLELTEEGKIIIQKMVNAGLLTPRNSNVTIYHPVTDRLEDMLTNSMDTITLQITQNCNLRCKYCVYSGSYINRTHNNKRMSLDTAKEALHFLHRHSKNSKKLTVGFYGGEPLLEIGLIKSCVSLCKNLFDGKDVQYTMTTNATLLDVKTAKYLLDNNFSLIISLDGPRDIQNANRVYANGRGTYDDVYSHLVSILNALPEYREKIMINGVMTQNDDMHKVINFFQNDYSLQGINTTIQYATDVNLADEKVETNSACYEQNYIEESYETFKLFLFGIGRLQQCDVSTLLMGSMLIIKEVVHDRNIGTKIIHNKTHPGGPCIPGRRKLFVDVDGRLFPCERVSETSPVMCMGTLSKGFDISKAKEILNIASITASSCLMCWAQGFCNQCVANADGGDTFSAEKRLKHCAKTKRQAEDMVKNYIVLIKYGCQFERFQGVTEL